jgi:hypothetical protein
VHNKTRIAFALTALSATLWPGGCDRGGDEQPDTSQIIGTWVETRDAPALDNPRLAYQPPPFRELRQITISPDGTFTMVLVPPEGGEPLLATGTLEGTWKVDEGYITFETTENNLPEGIQNVGPDSAGLPRTDPSGETWNVVTKDEGFAIFKRKN